MNLSNYQLRKGKLYDFEMRKDTRKFTGYTLFVSFFIRSGKPLQMKKGGRILDFQKMVWMKWMMTISGIFLKS